MNTKADNTVACLTQVILSQQHLFIAEKKNCTSAYKKTRLVKQSNFQKVNYALDT